MIGAAAMLMGNAYKPLTVSLSTSSVSGSATGSDVNSNSVTAIPDGGSSAKSYAWELVSGSVSINSANSASTAFYASIGSPGGSASGSARCRITDLVTGEVIYTGNVSIFLQRSQPPLSGSASGSAVGSINSPVQGAVHTSYVTIVPSGGVSPYTYAFFKTGPPGDTASVEPSGNQARFAAALGPGQSLSPTAKCTITDDIGQTYDVQFGGSLANVGSPAPPLSASVDPPSVYGIDTGPTVYAGPVTVTPSGGVAPYGYSWTRIDGVGSATGGQTSQFVHSFAVYGDAGGTFRCTVTDSIGQTASTTVSAAWTYWQGIQF